MIAHVGDVAIAYDDIGTGPPVVFLHAFPLDRTMWAPQTSALAARCRCIAVDARGMGESAGGPPFTMDSYANDVVGVLDAIGVDQAAVVGLSMGGYVAFALWRRHRRRVRALVLADTRAGPDDAKARAKRQELAELARRDGSSAVADRQITGLLGKTTRERHPHIVAAVQRMMSGAKPEGIIGALEAMMARPDSRPTLATIDVPALVIVGDEDVLTPTKEARAIGAAVAGSRLEVLTQAGHLSNIERPAAFNALLAEFLASLNTN